MFNIFEKYYDFHYDRVLKLLRTLRNLFKFEIDLASLCKLIIMTMTMSMSMSMTMTMTITMTMSL